MTDSNKVSRGAVNINMMRKLDRWLGVPLCFILTVIDKVFARSGSKEFGPVEKILFVKPAEQGATVLAYPAIKAAVDRVGRENVFFIVFEKNRSILDVMEVIAFENIITIPGDSLFKTAKGIISAVMQARRQGVDTVVDFEFFSRGSAIISYLSGASRRVGLHSYCGEAAYRGSLMTHRIPYNDRLHVSETFRLLVESIDASVEKLPAVDIRCSCGEYELPRFHPGGEEVEEVKGIILNETGLEKLPGFILLNANAGDLLPLRRWPGDNYAELARRIIDKYSENYIIFTGSSKEAEPAEQLVRQVGSERCISLAGKSTFRQLMVLYQLGKLLVTNDSGPVHFAGLSGSKVIVLFGPETPALFSSLGAGCHVMYAGLGCSPCISIFNGRRSACKDNLCMQAITVEQVFSQVCRVLDDEAD